MHKDPIQVSLTWAETEAVLAKLLEQPLVSLDTEWYNYDKDKPPVNNGLAACVTLAYLEKGRIKRHFIYNFGDSEGNINALAPWLRSKDHVKLAHNATSDWHIIANHGIIAESLDEDTMVLDWLYDENREYKHNLKECMEDHLGVERLPYAEVFGSIRLKKDGTEYASRERIVPLLEDYLSALEPRYEIDEDDMGDHWNRFVNYATNDAEDALMLRETVYRPKMELLKWIGDKTYFDLYQSIDRPIISVIQRMERHGMPLDMPFLEYNRDKALLDQQKTEAAILEIAGCPMNVGSKQQLAKLLYGVGVFPVKKGKKTLYNITGRELPCFGKTDSGDPSTDAAAMKKLARWLKKEASSIEQPFDIEESKQLVELIREHSARSTQIKTFLIGLTQRAVRGRAHTRVNPIGTTSGRWSTSEPNLQNISTGEKDTYNLRDSFCALLGYCLIVADFSQLEYRLLAHFSQEPKLIKAFERGWDLHSLTTYNIFPNVKHAVDAKFGPGGENSEHFDDALKWIAEEFPNERKRGKCVHPSTLIRTDGGYSLIGEIVEAAEDSFAVAHGAYQVEGPESYLNINSVYNGGNKDLVAVVSRRGLLVCTPQHKLRLADGKMVEAGKLKKGDELEEATLDPLPHFLGSLGRSITMKLWDGVPPTEQPVTEDLAYFAGVFHGDGTNNESSAAITHGSTQGLVYSDWQDTIVDLCTSLGMSPERKERQVYLGSRVFVSWLTALGLSQPGGKRKRMDVPSWVMNSNLFPHYFAGLFDTDGTVSSGRASITTKWATYAGQLATLLKAHGYPATVEATFNKTYQRWYYRVVLRKQDSYVLLSELSRLKHKKEALSPGEQHSLKKNIVTHVIPQGTGPCVDLNVPGHVYIANGFVTHNTLNFEIIYGVGYRKLAEQLEIPEDEAKRMVDGWNKGYPYVVAWKRRVLNEFRIHGYYRTLDGHMRHAQLHRLNSDEYGIRGEEERTLINAIIQGSAAAMTKKAMLNIHRDPGFHALGGAFINQVHDELIIHAPLENRDALVTLIRPHMEQPFSRPLRVKMPVSIGVGPTWATAKA